MKIELATKPQLIQIARYEECNLDLKYQAARELQERYIDEEIRADILYRLGIGISIEEVALENGLTQLQVIDFLRAIHYKHKTDFHTSENWKVGYKQTLQACGRKLYKSEKAQKDIKGRVS